MILLTTLIASGSGGDTAGFPSQVADAHDQIVLGLIGILGIVITALVYIIKSYGNSKTAAEQSTQTNAAVNHTEYGERRLYEMVKTIEQKQAEFDKRWGNLPHDMDTAVNLAELLHTMHQEIFAIRADIKKLHPDT